MNDSVNTLDQDLRYQKQLLERKEQSINAKLRHKLNKAEIETNDRILKISVMMRDFECFLRCMCVSDAEDNSNCYQCGVHRKFQEIIKEFDKWYMEDKVKL